MIRLALVGFGRWGRNYVTAAREAGNAVVQTVVLPPESSTPTNGIVVSHDLEEAAYHADAVVIAAHPRHAVDLCERVLALGKPVMLEKPAGLSLDDATRIENATRRAPSDTPFLVSHQLLFSHGFELLRDEVFSRGAATVESVGVNAGPYRDYSPLWDYGPHDIAMLLGLGLGAPSVIASVVERESAGHGQLWHLAMTMPRGAASMTVGNGATARKRVITARSGDWFATFDNSTPPKAQYTSPAGTVEFYAPPLTLAVRAFARAVATGDTDWRFGGAWATRVARVLQAAETLAVRASF